MLRRVLERGEHALLRDLVEHQAADLLAIAAAELLGEVPADRLALAVRVGRDEDLGASFAASFSSLRTFLRLAMTSYDGSKPSSTSTPSLLFGRSRTWPIEATTL